VGDIFEVRLAAQAKSDLKNIPLHLLVKLDAWVKLVSKFGLREVRKRSGYHDEPLKGVRFGQRSIRLNKAYRAIYVLGSEGVLEFITVEEVNKHDY
jgi:toxin HigB-1